MRLINDPFADDPCKVPPGFGMVNDFLRPDDVVTIAGVTHTIGINVPTNTETTLAGGTLRGGIATLTTDVNDEDGGFFYSLPAHVLAKGKTVSFKARVALTRASAFSTCTFMLGVTSAVVPLATGAIDAAGAVADGVYFYKPEAVDTVNCCVATTAVAAASLATVPAATLTVATTVYNTFGISIEPTGLEGIVNYGNVEWSINGKPVHRVHHLSIPLEASVQCAMFGLENKSGVATVLGIDYFSIYQLR